ncbi:argininosuccinate synthase [Acidobacteria bacterium AH-259-L09]|nr:argininosuccinate synthase [Acidobacteria bacterium AH-259-L09]
MEKGSGGVGKIVLAYSGGLDTSVMLHWLKERYGCPILAFVADIGQGEDLHSIEKKAYETGADEVVISDLRKTFVRDFVFPAMQAHALYEGEYLLGTSLARPVIARRQVQVAEDWGADTVAHGATGKGNDQVRFELTYQGLAPQLKILAPWRTWEFHARTDLIRYAQSRAIPVSSTEEKPYSIDQNIMHSSYEGGILEDPWQPPPEEIFLRTTAPQEAPGSPTEVLLDFEEGVPVKFNDKELGPVEILEELNHVAGANGVGRVDVVENRMVGMKSRGVYETPGVTVLHKAHRALESLTLDREVQHFKDELAPRIAELIYYGFWFAPEMQLLLQLIKNSQKRVSGKVNMQLYKGNCVVRGRSSPFSLYDPAYATFEADQVYTQADAQGFIRLQGLRLKIAALLSSQSE